MEKIKSAFDKDLNDILTLFKRLDQNKNTFMSNTNKNHKLKFYEDKICEFVSV